MKLTLKLVVSGEPAEIEYDTPEAVLGDMVLKGLFDGDHVWSCEVYSEGQRMAGLPFMEWSRLQDALERNFK